MLLAGRHSILRQLQYPNEEHGTDLTSLSHTIDLQGKDKTYGLSFSFVATSVRELWSLDLGNNY